MSARRPNRFSYDEELLDHLEATTALFLRSLMFDCRRRFLRAADLVGVRGEAIDALRAFGVTRGFDLRPLFPAWRALCDRYAIERYDPQQDLFLTEGARISSAWSHFVDDEIFPLVRMENEVVRNILRAIAGLPCRSREAAANAVQEFFLAVEFEPPLWQPYEEKEDLQWEL